MAYCTEDDLLLGDVRLGAGIDPQAKVEEAAAEIDAKLVLVYQLPLPLSGMAMSSVLTLKRINAHLATGRLILEVAVGAEMATLNAYGRDLIAGALGELEQITCGTVTLIGATKIESAGRNEPPEVKNADRFSGVDFFESFVGGQVSGYGYTGPTPAHGYWRPGQ